MTSQRNAFRWSAILLLFVVGVGFGVSSCGDDSDPVAPNPPGPAADLTVNIVAQAGASSFSPNPAVITEGQTIAWRNVASDNNPHTATSDVGGVFNTGTISIGATSASITMNVAGDFPYHCGIHPAMVGTVTVNPHLVTIVANNGSNSFSPNPIVIKVGQSIRWRNSAGGEIHSAVSDLGVIPPFDTGAIANGATSAGIVFNTAGTFNYHCEPHATMTGTITVNP